MLPQSVLDTAGSRPQRVDWKFERRSQRQWRLGKNFYLAYVQIVYRRESYERSARSCNIDDCFPGRLAADEAAIHFWSLRVVCIRLEKWASGPQLGDRGHSSPCSRIPSPPLRSRGLLLATDSSPLRGVPLAFRGTWHRPLRCGLGGVLCAMG